MHHWVDNWGARLFWWVGWQDGRWHRSATPPIIKSGNYCTINVLLMYYNVLQKLAISIDWPSSIRRALLKGFSGIPALQKYYINKIYNYGILFTSKSLILVTILQYFILKIWLSPVTALSSSYKILTVILINPNHKVNVIPL